MDLLADVLQVKICHWRRVPLLNIRQVLILMITGERVIKMEYLGHESITYFKTMSNKHIQVGTT